MTSDHWCFTRQRKRGGEVSPEPEALEVRASGAVAGVPPGDGQWCLVSLVNLVRASGVSAAGASGAAAGEGQWCGTPTVTLD